jgi:hypothetical protein
MARGFHELLKQGGTVLFALGLKTARAGQARSYGFAARCGCLMHSTIVNI